MKSRNTLIVIVALLGAAVTLSATGFGNPQSCCLGMKQHQGATIQTAQQEGAQTAAVSITDKGFEPASLKLKAGVPAKVSFTRKTDETCAKEVVLKDYSINQKLPLNETVTVEFTPRKGEFAFGCGMSMLKGKLIVE